MEEAATPEESPWQPAAGDATAGELATLRDRLTDRQAMCQQLEEQVAAARAEQAAVQQSSVAGIEAARIQMMRMWRELAALRQQQQARLATDDRSPASDVEGKAADLPPGTEPDEDGGERQALQLQARALRHELSKWDHQVKSMEADAPRQAAEIEQLKAQLTHAQDVVESTKNAISHQYIEREKAELAQSSKELGQIEESDGKDKAPVPLHGGGHANIEATAERSIREQAEARNEALASKARRLTGVARAQQTAIQRLERDLMKLESDHEQREVQLAAESRRKSHLKGALRRCSDDIVAMALGMAPLGFTPPGPAGGAPAQAAARAASLPPGFDPEGSSGGSAPRASSVEPLPPIAA